MLAYIRTMAQYNQWMNERLMLVCDELSADQMKADLGAFFHSILGTWNHIMIGDLIWMRRLAGHEDLPLNRSLLEGWPAIDQLNQIILTNWSEFKEKRRQLDEQLLRLSRDLKPQQLGDSLQYKTTTGDVYENKIWLILTHLFNHQTHHRGQLTDLIHQQGVNPGVTDLIAMCREQELAKHIG